MPDDIGEVLIRRAGKWGATNLRIEPGGKHPRLVGDYRGVAFMFVFPSSTGDRRAVLNCLSDLRRVIGVERQTKERSRPRKQRPRRTKPRHVSMRHPVEPVVREDRFYAPLRQLRATMTNGSEDDEVAHDQVVRLRTPFLGRRQRFAKA